MIFYTLNIVFVFKLIADLVEVEELTQYISFMEEEELILYSTSSPIYTSFFCSSNKKIII